MWRKLDSESSWGAVREMILKSARSQTTKIVIGSDSQPIREGAIFVTAIAFISEDRSLHGTFFYLKTLDKSRYNSLYERILRETMVSIEIANKVREEAPYCRISVHLDVSPQGSKSKTSKYASAMTSLVRGYGYDDVEVKPNSWCASSVADYFTKGRAKKLRNKTWPILRT